MQQAFPSIPQEVKDRLHQKGFRPYKAEPLPDFLNPHSAVCKKIHYTFIK